MVYDVPMGPFPGPGVLAAGGAARLPFLRETMIVVDSRLAMSKVYMVILTRNKERRRCDGASTGPMCR